MKLTKCKQKREKKAKILSVFSTGQWMCRPGYDGGEADDAAATDGGRSAVAGAGGELHGNTEICFHF